MLVMKNSNFWHNRKVLVTGATGFIGSWLVKELLKREVKVFALVRKTTSHAIGQNNIGNDELTWIKGRVENLGLLEKTIRLNNIETIFHLAAKNVNIGKALSPVSTFETNLRGTYNLLEGVRRQPKLMPSVILASSKEAGLVYGPEGSIREKRHPYEVSKTCMELIADCYADLFGLNIVIVRSENVYGGGDQNWRRLIPSTIRFISKNERPVIRNGDIQRDYVYIRDVVDAYLRLGEIIEKKQLDERVIYFGTEKVLTSLEVVKKICRMMNFCDDPVIIGDGPNERPHTFESTKKTRELLDWLPKYDINNGLKETIEWYNMYFAENSRYPNLSKPEKCLK